MIELKEKLKQIAILTEEFRSNINSIQHDITLLKASKPRNEFMAIEVNSMVEMGEYEVAFYNKWLRLLSQDPHMLPQFKNQKRIMNAHVDMMTEEMNNREHMYKSNQQFILPTQTTNFSPQTNQAIQAMTLPQLDTNFKASAEAYMFFPCVLLLVALVTSTLVLSYRTGDKHSINKSLSALPHDIQTIIMNEYNFNKIRATTSVYATMTVKEFIRVNSDLMKDSITTKSYVVPATFTAYSEDIKKIYNLIFEITSCVTKQKASAFGNVMCQVEFASQHTREIISFTQLSWTGVVAIRGVNMGDNKAHLRNVFWSSKKSIKACVDEMFSYQLVKDQITVRVHSWDKTMVLSTHQKTLFTTSIILDPSFLNTIEIVEAEDHPPGIVPITHQAQRLRDDAELFAEGLLIQMTLACKDRIGAENTDIQLNMFRDDSSKDAWSNSLRDVFEQLKNQYVIAYTPGEPFSVRQERWFEISRELKKQARDLFNDALADYKDADEDFDSDFHDPAIQQ